MAHNILGQVFNTVKDQKRTAFMPFFVAGFPDFNRSCNLIQIASRYADVIELGIPYSDPLADGTVVQQANDIALQNGMNIFRVCKLIKTLRKRQVHTPIVLMAYANLVSCTGVDVFYRYAKEAGADAVLIPDVPLEEIKPYTRFAKRYGLRQILLASLATDNKRLRSIDQLSQGFIYLVSVLGTTGVRKTIDTQCIEYLKKASVMNLRSPVCVGFGVSSRLHAVALAKAGAHGYIVGSALLKFILKNQSKKDLELGFERFIKTFKL
jgi:tryptophan synthase alpha chain